MKKNFLLSIFVIVFAVFTLSSCSKFPQVEIDAANQAISEAKTAQADVYVPEAFNALTDSMNAVLEGIEVQKSKLFKSYKASTEKLVAVSALAVDVKVQAESKIAELKAAIQTTISEITAINLENNDLVAKAPKGKGGTTVLMAIKAEIANIDVAIAELAAIPETENLNTTLGKGKALKEQAVSINTELKTVIEKYQSKNK